MDITDQGAQMEPLLPTVRLNRRSIVVFMFKFMYCDFDIWTNMNGPPLISSCSLNSL